MAEPKPLGFAGAARSVRTGSAVALETGGGTFERATMKTLYDVLGVPRNANSERIRTAFRKAAKAYHPDLNAGDPTAEQQIKRVIAAYEILKSPHEREAYDQHLRACRRARVRQFAGSAVASLGAILVAFGVALAILQSNTQEETTAPPTSSMVSANVNVDTRQQVATADRGRQEANWGRKSDWGGAPDHRTQDRQQTGGDPSPGAGSRELYAGLTREREPEAISEPMAYAARTHESELARSELIVLINAVAPSTPNSLKKHSFASNSLKKKRSLEQRATRFVSSQIAGRSSPKASDLSPRARAYADHIVYHGSRKSRQAVLLEKRRELPRWSGRVYDAQRDSMTVRCLSNACKAYGTIAWKMRNGHRATPASGISKFDYDITRSGDGFRILGESASVVKRYRQADGRNYGRLTKLTAYHQRCERSITSNESSNPVDQSCAMRKKL